MPWSQDKYIQAYKFAANAHQGQLVPGTQISYIMHLSLVSMEVIAALGDEPVGVDQDLAVQCALLHDVIEDTPVSYGEVVAEFGVPVANGVLALSKSKSLDRAEQMSDSLRRIQEQPLAVWMVKLADRITNLQKAPAYWNTEKKQAYRTEAIQIWNALKPASESLARRLREKIDTYQTT